MKSKKKILISLIAAIVAVVVIVAVAVSVNHKPAETAKTPSTAEPVTTASAEPKAEYVLDDDKIQELRDELSTDEQTNGDVKGILYFESELIHQPTLQGTDNNYYLYHNWQTGADETWGSITIDYENNISNDDMNTILYGHYVYNKSETARKLAFTPLSLLLDQANYEDNKYVAYVTDTDVRYYVVANVYKGLTEQIGDDWYPVDDLQYNLVSYDESYFNTYMNAVKQNQYYDTGVSINYGDHMLTLQTCIENQPDDREIILCKELAKDNFTE